MITLRNSSCGIKQGQRIGKWEVLGPPFRIDGVYVIVARCSCAEVSVVNCNSLSQGQSHGCKKCAMRETNSRKITHGDSRGGTTSRLYRVWNNIKDRCQNTNHCFFHCYGGRGITVCSEWAESYATFRNWAIANGYEEHLQIDRIDNDGNYEPTNCRFVTRKNNSRNRRTSVFSTAFGETKTLADWADDNRCRVNYSRLWKRIKDNWTAERAITEPARRMAVT